MSSASARREVVGGIDPQEIGGVIDIHSQQLQDAPQSGDVPLSKVVLGKSGWRGGEREERWRRGRGED